MKKTLSMLALAVLTVGLLGSCTRIDNLEKRVDSLEKDKIATIDSQIASIQSSIKKLDQIDGLSKRADELEAFITNDLASRSWVDATFASLEQYQVTCDTVAKLKEKLGQTDEKIDECVESLKDWINSEFNDYYKIAEIDAKLKALKDTTLADAIAATKEELTAGYKAAIKAAIEDNDGFVTPEIKNAIGSLNGKVDVLTSKVNSIEEEISQIKSMIQSIEFEPAYTGEDVGKYFGDIDTTDLFLDLALNYRIKPAAALDSIFASGTGVDSLFSLYYRRVNVPVRDPETRAYVENPKMNVKSLTRSAIDSELVTILIGSDEFNRLPVRNYISDHTSLAVALGVKAGKTDMISDYTTVNFEEVDFSEERENLYRQMAILIGSRQPGKDYNAYRVLFNMCGDDVVAAGRDHDGIAALNQFRYTADNPVIYECYTNLYKAIDVCNQFIYKYFNPQKGYEIRDSRIPAGDTDPSRRCLAEARVLRAWLHFTLANGWGTPPMDTISPALSKPTNSTGKENVFKWCIEELTDCIDSGSLVDKSNVNDTETICVVSKQFAQALAGKVCLFSNKTTEAANFLKAVIESGRYELDNEFPNNFRSVGNRNVEKIFELDMEKYSGPGYVDDSLLPYMGMETDLWNWYSNGFIADPMARVSSIKGKGELGVPQSFVQNFVDYEGQDGYRLQKTLKDVRTAIVSSTDYESSEIGDMSPGDREQSNKVGIKAEGLYGQSFYFPNKTLALNDDLNPWNGNRRTNFTIMRYAEVLLLAAEASLNSGAPSKATEYCNVVRRRAKLSNRTNVTLTDIIDEKSYELWMEGCRWADLVRWSNPAVPGTGINMEELLGKAGVAVPVLYDKLTRSPKNSELSYLTWENGTEANSRFYTVTYDNPKAASCGFKKDKHELFPFPAAVRKSNPNLKQNQGW